MRKLLLFFIMVAPLFLEAQTIQRGKVLEQNSGGRAVENVEVRVAGAVPTITDNEGVFRLYFSNKKPGEKIIVEDIFKDGYEAVNQKDIDNWIFSDKEEFIIILCKLGTLSEAREHYYEVGKNSLEQNFDDLKAQNTLLLERQEITEQEYKQRLADETEKYRLALEKLDYFSDKLSRINKDDIDSLSFAALQLFEAGNINGAIAIYQNSNSLQKLKEKRALRDETLEDIDNLIVVLEEENDYRLLAGGAENYRAVETNLEEIAATDSTNAENILKLADFLYETRQFQKAVTQYEKAERHTTDIFDKMRVFNYLASSFQEARNYERAETILNKALVLEDLINDKNSILYLENSSLTMNILGLLYINTNKLETAKTYLDKALQINKKLMENPSEKHLLSYARNLHNTSTYFQKANQLENAINEQIKEIEIYEKLALIRPDVYNNQLALSYTNLGSYYYNNDNGEKSKFYHLKAYAISREMAKDSTNIALDNLALSASNLGSTCKLLNQYEQAKKYSIEAQQLYEYLVVKDPLTYNYYLYHVYNNMGTLYSELADYEEAESFYLLSLKICEELANTDKDVNEPLLAATYNNIGLFYVETGEYQKAEENYASGEEIYQKNVKKLPLYLPEYASLLDNYAYLYQILENYGLSEKYYLESLNLRKKLAKVNPDAYLRAYAFSLNNMGYFYGGMQNMKKAVKYIEESTEILEVLTEKDYGTNIATLAGNYNNLGFLTWKSKRYEKSEKYYLKSVGIIDDIQKQDPENAEAWNPEMAQYSKNLAIMYFEWNHLDEALKYFNISLPLYRDLTQANPDKYEVEVKKIEDYLGKIHQ